MSANQPAPARPAGMEASIFVFPPIVHVIWGSILIGGNLLGNMMQVQSTQSWFLGTNNDWQLNWSLWAQFPQFWSGQLNRYQVIAFIASWGAQLVLMTTKIGLGFVQAHNLQSFGRPAHLVENIIKEAKVRVGVWNGLAWLIIFIDSLTDWAFSGGVGFWQQIFFISITFLCTFYFGTWGIQNLVAGFSRMKG